MALPDGSDESEVEPDIEQLEHDLDQMRAELEEMLDTLAGRVHEATDVRLQLSRHPWAFIALGALVLGGTTGAALRRARRPAARAGNRPRVGSSLLTAAATAVASVVAQHATRRLLGASRAPVAASFGESTPHRTPSSCSRPRTWVARGPRWS